MSLYDYPRYYDLVYGSDWKAEVDFLNGVFKKHVSHKTKRLLEPACGTGRLMFRLERAGLQVDGIDLSEKAVDYCNKRLLKHGFRASARVADMTDFQVKSKYCAAFNTINSFRHLEQHAQARAHLVCMGQAIRKGGVYILGLHLSPGIGEAVEEESWIARRGQLCVQTSMWLVDRNLEQRYERFHMRYDIWTPTDHRILDDEFNFRTYTKKQFEEELLGKVREFEIATTYDFSYNLNHPIEVDDRSEDVVYILKRV
ncbi:MAG: methyltransferase type 11 [Planctomycetaceae bacterium]|nr:methyltransferase type 11 [Planctomycetaceae bacterium]